MSRDSREEPARSPKGVDYSPLASDYQSAHIGYSPELYAMMESLGLNRRGSILDVACGTGIAAEPLAPQGAKISGIDICEPMLAYARSALPEGEIAQGKAEALPFPNAVFDGVICAQAFHWFDPQQAMDEMVRVLKPGGAIAIWWKHLMSDDAVKAVRDEVSRGLGVEVPDAGLSGGFIEFYRAPLLDHTLRVVPWRMAVPLDRFMAYERSRATLREVLGSKLNDYLSRLEEKLEEQYGANNPFLPLSYLHFLYTGKKL
ncbi:MAG: class I SAM-dependent methyltransferase [Vulcanimicrobiaceae bacterium]